MKLTEEHLAKLAEGKKNAKRKGPITHTVRTFNDANITIKNYTRSLAIKVFCVECLGWEGNVKECNNNLSPLFPFRGNTRKTKG